MSRKIEQSGIREKDGMIFGPDVFNKTIAHALESLVVYEIGYGGVVTDLMPTKVSVVTRVMNCTDTTTYSGSEEDMKLLVEAASLSVLTDPFGDKSGLKYKDKVIDNIMAVTGGNPLMIKLGADFFKGQSHLKVLLAAMLLKNEEDVKIFGSTIIKIPVKDLMPILTLVKIDSVPLDEAIALAA